MTWSAGRCGDGRSSPGAALRRPRLRGLRHQPPRADDQGRATRRQPERARGSRRARAQDRRARRQAPRRAVRLRLPQHDARRRPLQDQRRLRRLRRRSSWRRRCRARRPCSPSSAAPIRTRSPRGKVELAQQHGKTLADEVRRVLAGELRPVRGAGPHGLRSNRTSTSRRTSARRSRRRRQSPDKFEQARAKLMLAAYDAGQPVRRCRIPCRRCVWATTDPGGPGGRGRRGLRPAAEAGVPQGEPDRDRLHERGARATSRRCAVLRGGGYEPGTA